MTKSSSFVEYISVLLGGSSCPEKHDAHMNFSQILRRVGGSLLSDVVPVTDDIKTWNVYAKHIMNKSGYLCKDVNLLFQDFNGEIISNLDCNVFCVYLKNKLQFLMLVSLNKMSEISKREMRRLMLLTGTSVGYVFEVQSEPPISYHIVSYSPKGSELGYNIFSDASPLDNIRETKKFNVVEDEDSLNSTFYDTQQHEESYQGICQVPFTKLGKPWKLCKPMKFCRFHTYKINNNPSNTIPLTRSGYPCKLCTIHRLCQHHR
jgi:hypothetical protein